jgi:predicted aspartyl protease
MEASRVNIAVRTAASGLLLVSAIGAAHAQDTPAPAPSTGSVRTLPPAQIDNTLAIGGEAIDARKLRSRMTVAVRINGSDPLRFVVDSGADTSVVGTQLAGRMAFEPSGSVLVNGMTESALVPQVRLDTLELGPTAFNDLYVPVLQERNIGADGIIGLDALVEQRLMLDFEKRVISVDDARIKPKRLDGEIVVTARLRRGQLILTEARARDVPIDVVVDTGSEVTIGNSALRQRLFRRGAKGLFTAEVTGVTGATTQLDVAIVPELRIGPVILRNVPIAFADVTPFRLFGLTEEPALLLGTDLMENFRKVSLDFRARKVRFQLKRCSQTGARFGLSDTFVGISTDTATAEACSR